MQKKKMAAVGTLAALLAVLVIAFVGRSLLAGRVETEVPSTEVASSSESSAEDSSESNAVMLADYDATVYTEQGEPLKLTDIAGGRPLVMNFWATWCPYCVDELPDFQKIVADFGDEVSFAFLDVADGSREKVDDAKQWLIDQGFDDLPSYYDTSLEASMRFGATALPTTVVVSAEGEVLTITAGRIDPILLRGALKELV